MFCFRLHEGLRQLYPFVQIFDLGINGYTAAQRARLKSKMERRRLAAKWLIKQSMTGLPRSRRVADALSVVGFVKAA